MWVGRLEQREGGLQTDLGEPPWACCCGIIGGLGLIVNLAVVSLSLCLFFEMNRDFSSFILVFLLCGLQWQVALFSLDKLTGPDSISVIIYGTRPQYFFYTQC